MPGLHLAACFSQKDRMSALENLSGLVIDPWQLAAQACRLHGTLVLAQLPRLQSALFGDSGLTEINWRFSLLHGSAHALIEGQLSACFTVQCQRCLQAMPWPVQAEIALFPLKPGQQEPDDLPAQVDCVPLLEQRLKLAELVEDELILLLPVAPLHEACAAHEYQMSPSTPSQVAQVATASRKNPFAVLADWPGSKGR